ncbi:MAG TPA: succinylglutamate desuccinylase/aspartoacylase family protein [Verrucomicrobiota bacterium]|nr:succinylglutamate desuccinylase/aspartoacylase family protein [Verrucomicrobiota bacterium]
MIATPSRVSPVAAPSRARRSISRFLEPFEQLVGRSSRLLKKPLAEFTRGGETYHLPRYVFVGPKGGGDTLRLGLFATIQGDEPAGGLALARFLEGLEAEPELAKGYLLCIYPLCNPTGFEAGTRHARSGRDLNREFWKSSAEPEVRRLETELWMHAFHGLVNLHSDDTSHGLYGFVQGTVLSQHLLEPALTEAQRFLPRNHGSVIDGFRAEKGVISDCYHGVLRALPGLEHPPQQAPLFRQVEAFNAALRTILTEFRYLNAVAANI